MKITFLGTGTSQGVPIIACECIVCSSADPKDKRLRSSVWIEDEGSSIVIDSGPDFRQQLLREKVKQLDAVVFTHEHKDHIAGLDEVRAFNYLYNRPVDIWATTRVQAAIRTEFAYIFSETKYPGIPEINLHTIENTPFSINKTELIPVDVLHYQLPVKGFRIHDFGYVTDANYISDPEKEKLKGLKVLVLNALRREKHISHYTLSEALELIAELKPEKTYLTHLSHQMGLHADVSKELPPHVELAYDGLKIEL
ncbi:MAG: fold metallo-hydrolase [Bacteroidetes bacterium]|jgi:phosphoribosyl 1,2-cyclic phosphate phosphodiesterase|nr:fold metallo-hydrolase [Bacteroidota bacterium]